MKHLALIAVLGCMPVLASDLDSEAWFDQAEAEEARLRQINAGALEFHASPPATRIHHLHNRLDINRDSLESGYVELRQCHENLDPIRRAEVNYRHRSMKDLRLESWEGMEQAWVEGDSVQMVNVGEGARLCVRAGVALLQPGDHDDYVLRSGPFHRRFLDGYFPMKVHLEIRYPASLLRFARMDPPPQPGLALVENARGLSVEALFSGILAMELGFQRP